MNLNKNKSWLISHTFRTQNERVSRKNCFKLLILLEGAIGIEPMNKAFAVHFRGKTRDAP
jgi:hypothetical protein